MKEQEFLSILGKYHGRTKTFVMIMPKSNEDGTPVKRTMKQMGARYNVIASDKLIAELKGLYGEDNVFVRENK